MINAVPLLPGYRWHRIARIWRTPLLGELVMGIDRPLTLRPASRESNVTPGPLPEAWLDSVLDHFDQGTQRAILRLYRSSPPDVLAAAGAQLDELTMPALVVWGTQDPYIPARFGREYAERADATPSWSSCPTPATGPGSTARTSIDRVVDFLSAAGERARARASAAQPRRAGRRLSARGRAAGLDAHRGARGRVRDPRARPAPTSPRPAIAATCSPSAGFTLWDNSLVRRPSPARLLACSRPRSGRCSARSCSRRCR